VPTNAEAVPTGNNYVRQLDRGRQLCPGFPKRSTAGAESASRHLLVTGGAAAVSPRREPGGAWRRKPVGSRRSSRRRSRSDSAIRALLGQTEGLGRDTEREHHLSARDAQRWEVGWKLWVVHLDLVDTPMESGSMTDLSASAAAQWGYATFGADAVVGAEPGYDS